ncbi:MAG0920 family protein [Mycoplasmopsis felifaucium]|uniref:MAG0920 family protein n=1 Tax=Mycoplasmopsis felifaucium TaxID=35768 RepID=UPI00048694C9|nr:hypothetical protein [Mycoplasmopsis felifaucium]
MPKTIDPKTELDLFFRLNTMHIIVALMMLVSLVVELVDLLKNNFFYKCRLIKENYRVLKIKVNSTVLAYSYKKIKIYGSSLIACYGMITTIELVLTIINSVKYHYFWIVWTLILFVTLLWFFSLLTIFIVKLKTHKTCIKYNSQLNDNRLIENLSMQQYNNQLQISFDKNNKFENYDWKLSKSLFITQFKIRKRYTSYKYKVYWNVILNPDNLYLITKKQRSTLNYGSFYNELKEAGWIK